MSRSIQIGDQALVNGIPYTIKNLTDQGIYISPPSHPEQLLLLIPVNGQWKVDRYDVPHRVTFRIGTPVPNLTELLDTDRLILLELDYNSLKSACSTSRYLDKICQDDNFWTMKVRHDFGLDIIQMKPSEITSRQYYTYLVSATPNHAALNGLLGALIVFEREGKLPNHIGANWAASRGNVDILDWLADRNIYPYGDGPYTAVVGGHLNVLQWAHQRGLRMSPSEESLNLAAEWGHLDLLKWVADHLHLLPGEEGANLAAMRGQIGIVKWLATQGVNMNRYSDLALRNEMEKILKFVEKNDLL